MSNNKNYFIDIYIKLLWNRIKIYYVIKIWLNKHNITVVEFKFIIFPRNYT